MKLTRFIDADYIVPNSEASTQEEVLREIAKLASQNEMLKDIGEEKIYEKLSEREKLNSTSVGDRVAVPHCRFDGLKDFLVGVIILKKGIKFSKKDVNKTRLFFFVIGPSEKRTKHIKILAKIASTCKDEADTERLINCLSSEDVNACLLETEKNLGDFVEKERKYNQLTVMVQKNILFENVLNTLNEFTDTFITVVEGSSMSDYLYKVPIFSKFWADDGKGFNRLIVAVILNTRTNEILRKLNNLLDEEKDKAGMVFYMTELDYFHGKLKL